MNAARLNDQLCFALYSASHHLTAIYRPILEPLGLTYTQFAVMMALWESDGISITELASRTNLSKATMTPLLKKLEEKSLIKLDRMLENDRKKKVTVTATGKKLASKSISATEKAFCASGLSMDEAKLVIKICHKLTLNND
ncbi:MarR family winged helix-turn-helix transcriptional regulator [Thalassotalea atypica]|uniref:MarR family winged helix-turn-helix transcriptional regulator n=1 Tax=Thalassotalea atypica TaxID=2054316 RepID=UPI002574024B|nr:MarR family transcriptional regulator [Thalassotalea atypica]